MSAYKTGEPDAMKKKNFVGYEYQTVSVKRAMASVYADGYENFGWELEDAEGQGGTLPAEVITMRFKRDRRICNKAELIRLQRNFDACVNEILSLEASKHIKASVIAYTTGLIGTAFMAGSVFAVTAGRIVPCVLLAIPALAGWALPYFLFKGTRRKKTEEVTPLIDQKYDELYTVCEKAHALLT